MDWNEIGKKYLVDTLEFVKSGKELVATQGQMYIQELIKWEIMCGIGLVMVGLFLALAAYKTLNYHNKLESERLEKDKGKEAWLTSISSLTEDFAIFTSVLLSVASFILILSGAYDSAKAYVAPRVVVIEKLQRALR